MTCNLRALGLALVAVCALGAVAAQGASAVTLDDEFHGEKEEIVVTGTNAGGEGNHKFTFGTLLSLECQTVTTESTQRSSNNAGPNTYATDTITVTPHYDKCQFAIFEMPSAATVNFNHCAYVFDSETALGNQKKAGFFANVGIDCANEGEKIEIHTTFCTITIGEQEILRAARYKNITASEFTFEIAAEKITVGKVRNTGTQPVNGCMLFPVGTGATYTGNVITECFEDEGFTLEGTNKTTPTSQTVEGSTVGCSVAGA